MGYVVFGRFPVELQQTTPNWWVFILAFPLVLCTAITSSLKVIDPVTMQRGDISEEVYFRHPRPALMSARQGIEYMVLDCELTGLSAGKMRQAELTLARSRDLGSNDLQFRALTHLGNILSAGDTVVGYDLTAAVYNEADTKEWPKLVLPDVVVFKKVYPEARRRSRMWKLRSLIKEEEEGNYKSLHKMQDDDYENFLEDVDMDAEMRQRVNVYKDPAHFRITDDGKVVAPPRMAAAAEVVEEEDAGAGPAADGGLIGEPRCPSWLLHSPALHTRAFRTGMSRRVGIVVVAHFFFGTVVVVHFATLLSDRRP